MHDEAFDELVAIIYQAATCPSDWPKALQQLAQALQVQAVRLHGQDKHSQRTSFCFESRTSGTHPCEAEDGKRASRPPGVITSAVELHPMAWPLHEDDKLRVCLEIGYPTPANPPHTLDADLMTRLVHHLRHAVGISLVQAQSAGTVLVGQEILQRLPSPLVLLDESRRVLPRNRQVEQVLGSHPLLRSDDGMLRCTEARDDARLLLAMRSLRLSSRSYLGKAELQDRIYLCLRGNGRAHLGLYLHAMRGCAPMGTHMPGNLALLMLHAPSARSQADAQIVAATWRLTQAEASAAIGVSDGLRAADIAKMRRVSVHTVRTQLQQAMSKMGVTKQVELARQLSALSAYTGRQSAP